MKPTMRMLQGKLTVWNDEKGFGFIHPDNGDRDVFLHISALKEVNRRPQVGDVIYYQTVVEKNGKIRASDAVIAGVISRTKLKTLSLVLKVFLISILPIWGSITFGLATLNWLPLISYSVMSVITFVIYADDKSRATKGQRRIPEKTLHLCELAGGWLGAFIAQQKLRHKSSKSSYQRVFWVIVCIHMIFWVDWLFLGGKLMKLIFK